MDIQSLCWAQKPPWRGTSFLQGPSCKDGYLAFARICRQFRLSSEGCGMEPSQIRRNICICLPCATIYQVSNFSNHNYILNISISASSVLAAPHLTWHRSRHAELGVGIRRNTFPMFVKFQAPTHVCWTHPFKVICRDTRLMYNLHLYKTNNKVLQKYRRLLPPKGSGKK